jgi:hypothetical protein
LIILRHGHGGKGGTKQNQGHNGLNCIFFAKSKKIQKHTFFLALLENLASISFWIAIKVSTSKSFQLCPLVFFSSNYEKSFSFLAIHTLIFLLCYPHWWLAPSFFKFRLVKFLLLDFHDFHDFPYFFQKNWMLWEHNRDLLSKKLHIFFTTRDPHVWRLGGPLPIG